MFGKRSMKVIFLLQIRRAASVIFRSAHRYSNRYWNVGRAQMLTRSCLPAETAHPWTRIIFWGASSSPHASVCACRQSYGTASGTHATLLSDLGESLSTAQTRLGHARLSTTAEIYTHAVPASQRAAVEKLERTIWATKLDPIGPKLEASLKLGSTLIQ